MVDVRQRVDGLIRIVLLEDAKILDEQFAKSVGSNIVKLVNEMSQKKLLLNLSKVQFMASAMIGQLVLVRENCKRRGIELAICDLNPNLCEAIKLMRIDEILKVHDTEANALAAMSESSAG
ncbi:MAG TPA: STAS domain-containing protein [Pirellulaceae bacterium]|nr:STAS domain-containing protein [Pirellulaceae bacterium]HMO90623.1 STAS domain-containing protein [Pirellulaceae bacterium]HMP67798.1 STAS domain-containing protein [Pirellulaceae bacterium]